MKKFLVLLSFFFVIISCGKQQPDTNVYHEAEILNYFMIAELYNKGLYYCGVGSSWGSPCDKEMCEQYLSKFEVIGKAYRDWCISQR